MTRPLESIFLRSSETPKWPLLIRALPHVLTSPSRTGRENCLRQWSTLDSASDHIFVEIKRTPNQFGKVTGTLKGCNLLISPHGKRLFNLK